MATDDKADRAKALRAERLRRELAARKSAEPRIASAPKETRQFAVIPADQIKGDIFSKGVEDPEANWLQKQARSARYAAQTMLTTDPKARADMLERIVPNLQRAVDENGRPVVRGSDNEPWRYMNKPGIDAQDVTDFGGEVVKFAPAAKGATLGAGLISRAGIGATGGFLTSAGGDRAAVELGSKQGVDTDKAVFSAAGMAAGEFLAPPLQRLGSAIGKKLGWKSKDLGAKDAIRRISLEEAKRADDAVRRGIPLNDAEAAGVSRLADDFGIPLSKGQATGDFAEIAFEESARKGGRGEGAQRVMRQFAAGQQDAVKDAARGLTTGTRPSLNGGDAVARIAPEGAVDMTDAGEIIRQGVTQRRDVARKAVNEAYEAAKGAGATIDARAIPAFEKTVLSYLPDEVAQPGVFSSPQTIKDLYPKTALIMDDLALTGERLATRSKAAQGDITAIDFRDFERLRSRITQAANDATGRDKYALQQMRAGLDDWIEDAGVNALASGDETVIESFKSARQLRHQFGRLFEKGGQDDLAGRLVEDIVNKDMSAEQVVNTIFGAGEIGSTKASLSTVKRLKSILGPESPEWQAMRDAAMFKVMRKGFGVSGNEYAPGALKSALDKALDGSGKEVMRELYTPEELVRMREFRAVLQRLTPPKDATNQSGTADALLRAMWDFSKRIPGVNFVKETGSTMKAKAAARGVVQPPPQALLPRSGITAGSTMIESQPPR